MAPADPIVIFYSGGRDAGDRTLSSILAWDDARLEQVHDYIQWLFPTRQASGVNRSAPLVTDETRAAFAAEPALGDRLRDALDRMLRFYGLTRVGDRIVIDSARFSKRSAVWLTPGNHNHLRLTRILASLATLGRRADAEALRRCLLNDVAPAAREAISSRTLDFWRRAAGPEHVGLDR